MADDVDENRSEINLIPASIIANGTDKTLLTLTIKDKGGNILPDQQVEGSLITQRYNLARLNKSLRAIMKLKQRGLNPAQHN